MNAFSTSNTTWWKSSIVFGGMLCLSMLLLMACSDDDSDSPTTPTSEPAETSTNDGSCTYAYDCPSGGWVKSCVRDDLSAYYLSSDNRIFECTGSGTSVDCGDAAWDVAEYCQDKL